MVTKYPLDVKLDSSADQIDDVEYQKEHVERIEDNVSYSPQPSRI
jgi:tRNA1(Val) A37 N6-methylase TrmN6